MISSRILAQQARARAAMTTPVSSRLAPAALSATDPSTDPSVEPITGTVAEILAWVGDDTERAEQAYAAEQAATKPRGSLLTALEALTGKAGTEGEQ